MIELSVGSTRLEDIRGIAGELLRQAERCVQAGRPQQAEALLAQVWSLAHSELPALSDTAAWELAWLLAQRQAFAEADEWFGRVHTWPAQGQRLWPTARQLLRELCRRAAQPAAPLPTAAPALLQPLRIANLSRFQVVRGDLALPACTSGRSISIFRYLLTRRHYSARKEELMDLFWPNASPRHAAHNLHVAVSTLRRYLDQGQASYILFEAGCYLINSQAEIHDDCALFRHSCEEAERSRQAGDLPRAEQLYARAVASYQGDYDVDEQELDWAIGERERLLAQYLAALEQLGRLAIAQDHLLAGIERYQELLKRDPYREDIHYQVMRCYWQLGRRNEALRQYERCASALADDLGLEPVEDIQALYRSIVEGLIS